LLPPDHGSNSHSISIDNHNENCNDNIFPIGMLDADVGHNFYHDRELPVFRDAENLLQGAMRKSLEPMATTIYSVDSDEDDEERPASTPEKKEGMARFQFMSGKRDLSLDIARGVWPLRKRKGSKLTLRMFAI
jgi:hypothetical protein